MGTSVRYSRSMSVLPSVASTAVRVGESFESWLCRLSCLRRERVSVLIAELGDGALEIRSGSEWLWSCDEVLLARLSEFARVDIEGLRSALFANSSMSRTSSLRPGGVAALFQKLPTLERVNSVPNPVSSLGQRTVGQGCADE